LDQRESFGVYRRVAKLTSFPVYGERHDATPLDKVFDLQGTQFCPPEPVVEEDCENCPVPFALERGGVWGVKKLAGLLVRNRRRFSLIRPLGRSFDTMHRIDDDGVLFAEVIEEVRKRGKLSTNRRGSHGFVFQRLAPGDDVRSSDDAEVGEVLDANELHELPNIVPVGSAGVGIGDVGEPLSLGGNVGEALKLGLGDETLFWRLERDG
jgi:hypothetical protein